ncbi:malonic semialdehyde reductase [Caulobacter sp. Root656]|jgi:3-hydroxypropanoate dehydrogenase|uniref:Putative NADH dehydrogenase/NAD(P)H nitroreductase J2800_001719 n=1 Tax=Caulobacter rhizosphaerae TaxID=2010972 RepID=A0ABU1MXS8_9CAUL|nr:MULTISPECIES: malonic semialdehyde reductase [Caulobacter]KQZ28590.1 malonic semialdehyde reductase [Caulobacter sp. Root1472]KRA66785.1 malonic semialdehyde reductase [Caulobacter sp. Root656]MDR6530980.1 3-hydroxypropanoate dehydrogenase [Caulobacter rhizosphaerae]
MAKLADTALDQLFTKARTRNGWSDQPIPEPVLRELYDLVKFGPTAANTTPARFVFLQSPEAKARLAALSSGSNGPKILQAPVTVIIGYDLDFPETLDRLFPNAPGAKHWFGDPVAKEVAALRNSSLQGGYFILAARALGLDVGPMSGFDNAAVDKEFFAGTNIKSNFIASIGYGTEENLFPRNPRLAFEEATKIL